MKIKTVAFTIGITLLTSGCATLVGSKTQTINILADKKTDIKVDVKKM